MPLYYAGRVCDTPCPVGIHPGVSEDPNEPLVEAMRHLADQQVARAERVRAAGRQTFAYLTAVFTVAQAGTLSTFGSDDLTRSEQTLLLIVALLALGALGATGILALVTDRLRTAPEIAPEDLTEAAGAAEERGEPVSDELILLYGERAKKQSAIIRERRTPLKALTFFAGSTIVAVIVQIAIALVARFA